MGLSGGRMPPHKVTGYALIAFGGVIAISALPISFYMAIFGGVLAYVGYTLMHK